MKEMFRKLTDAVLGIPPAYKVVRLAPDPLYLAYLARRRLAESGHKLTRYP